MFSRVIGLRARYVIQRVVDELHSVAYRFYMRRSISLVRSRDLGGGKWNRPLDMKPIPSRIRVRNVRQYNAETRTNTETKRETEGETMPEEDIRRRKRNRRRNIDRERERNEKETQAQTKTDTCLEHHKGSKQCNNYEHSK